MDIKKANVSYLIKENATISPNKVYLVLKI